MAQHNCSVCKFRKTYDNRPDSLVGKLWRWHINWCPGFNRYLKSLPMEERQKVAENYNIKKQL